MSETDRVNSIKSTSPKAEADTIGKTRPLGLPRSDKNFKKIMNKESDSDRESFVDADEEVDDGEENVSLFDLSATKGQVKKTNTALPKPMVPLMAKGEQKIDPEAVLAETGDALESPDQNTKPNLTGGKGIQNAPQVPDDKTPIAKPIIQDKAALDEAGRMATAMNVKKKETQTTGLSLDTDATVLGPKKDKTKMGGKTRSDFSQENPDMAAVNPNRTAVAFNADKPQMEEEATQKTTMKELAALMIEKIQTMRTEGKTDTIVTLRHPPILEGATVTLSALDGAKREFNISFANLSEVAKAFLDRKLTEDNLSQILERKGIIVHTIITTTKVENPIMTDTENRQFTGDEESRQQRQQQQKASQQDLSEEELV